MVANEHDGGASMTGGIISILLGAAFLITAFLHSKRCDLIQGGFQVEEVPAAQTVSEMRRTADAGLVVSENRTISPGPYGLWTKQHLQFLCTLLTFLRQ